jgi:hypothetical protein
MTIITSVDRFIVVHVSKFTSIAVSGICTGSKNEASRDQPLVMMVVLSRNPLQFPPAELLAVT